MSRGDPRVSFVVCTHNGGERLACVVANLADRVRRAPVEILVVDNASTDGSASRLGRSPVGTAPPPRVVREEKLGLTHARRAGVEAARGEVIVFVDDDNVLLDGWAEKLIEIFGSNPTVAACGGYGIGCLPAGPIPWWFEQHCSIFAIGGQAEARGDVTQHPGHLWGAGLAVRREAVVQLFRDGFQSRAVDRMGSRLLSGGDSELCVALRVAGWRLWYDPALVFLHLLTEPRFRPGYLKELHFGFGRGSVLIDPYEWVLGDHARFPTRRHRSALWQLAIALRVLVNPRRAARRQTNVPIEFLAAMHRGRFMQLLRMGPAYDRSFSEIASAPWRRPR